MSKVMWEILVPESMPMETSFTEYWIHLPSAGEGSKTYKILLMHHQKWDAKVREIAGGLTIMRTAKGEWIGERNYLYQERMIPVRVVCDRPAMAELADFTKAHYMQEKVLYYKVSEEVYFV